jgi:uncharacterized protein YcfJ
MKKAIAILLSVSFLSWSGCSGMNNMEIGALTGAGVGGVAGGLIDRNKPLRGALIGAAVGALAGLVIGHYMDKRTKGAQETAQTYDYKPSQGTRVSIEDVRIEPEIIRPGKSSKLVMDYAVLDGNPDKSIRVTEKRTIKSNNKPLKEIGPITKNRNAGTYTTEQEVVFPSNIPEGSYQLRGQVVAGGKTSTKETYFQVVRLPGSTERYAVVNNAVFAKR